MATLNIALSSMYALFYMEKDNYITNIHKYFSLKCLI